MQEEISKQIYCNEWHFFSFQKTSTTQWHFGRYSKRKKNPTWTSLNSSYQQYKRPQFRNPTTYTIYKRLSKESLKHVVQESSQSEALSLSWEHFILTQVKGRGKGQYLTKILHLLQFIKRFFSFSQRQITFLYLHYRRAQLMDADCLATPRPYNIYGLILDKH